MQITEINNPSTDGVLQQNTNIKSSSLGSKLPSRHIVVGLGVMLVCLTYFTTKRAHTINDKNISVAKLKAYALMTDEKEDTEKESAKAEKLIAGIKYTMDSDRKYEANRSKEKLAEIEADIIAQISINKDVLPTVDSKDGMAAIMAKTKKDHAEAMHKITGIKPTPKENNSLTPGSTVIASATSMVVSPAAGAVIMAKQTSIIN